MLENLLFVATGWFMAAASYNARLEQIAADEALLKSVGVATDSTSLLAYFKSRTLSEAERAGVYKLIVQLGSPSYRLRDQATGELISRGPAVLEMLRPAVHSTDLETARRAELCITRIQDRNIAGEAGPAAARMLAVRNPAGAVETMLAYLPYADDDIVAAAGRTLLAALAREGGGGAHPALMAGLADALPARRAAAGEALCRAGLDEQKPAVRRLLLDADPSVRMRIAMTLANARDKDALPVLIDTLSQVPLAQAWQAEDLLFRLADGLAPPTVALGTDAANRAKCRAAWQIWWKEHAATVNLARLQEKPPLLGYTLVVLLDDNCVMELGLQNQTRWRIDNLVFPLDAQVISEGRVLIAEYHASRVTERDFKGAILWQKHVAGPLVAQRLPNGNTFIATDNQILEFDRADREVFSIQMTNERIMKAMKLASGEIVCLTDGSRVVRFDTTGKELYSYSVGLGTRLFGGRIYMLPSGGALIPHNAENKVVEYDARGKAVWEVAVDQPVAAVRLPNGNTLVTTMRPQRGAVEFDRAGHEVWTFRTTSRVTRALRR